MGFTIVVALALYLLISIGVVAWAVSHAKKTGKSAKRWGWGAAFVMYLIPFWDWIPTMVAREYYCVTNAGFWVYKDAAQWKKENPGVLETLYENNPGPEGISPNWPSEKLPDAAIAHINRRFSMVYRDHLRSPEEHELFPNVWRWQHELIDQKNNEVLARQIDFSTGNGYIGGEPPLKFWLQSAHCPGATEKTGAFHEFIKQIRGARP